MASGTATLDFTTGAMQTSVAVTGQAAILAGSKVGVAVSLTATAAHSVDEVRADPPRVSFGAIVAGTGFTVYGDADGSPLNGTYTVDWTWI